MYSFIHLLHEFYYNRELPLRKQFAVSTAWEREQEENPNKKKFCTGTSEDCYTLFCCCSRRVGSMFFLCEKRDGSPIVVAGPCW